jgi:hypothetical protein
MRESRTFGSVGGEGGNILAYPAFRRDLLDRSGLSSRSLDVTQPDSFADPA